MGTSEALNGLSFGSKKQPPGQDLMIPLVDIVHLIQLLQKQRTILLCNGGRPRAGCIP